MCVYMDGKMGGSCLSIDQAGTRFYETYRVTYTMSHKGSEMGDVYGGGIGAGRETDMRWVCTEHGQILVRFEMANGAVR